MPLLSRITNSSYKEWGSQINAMWPSLARQMASKGGLTPERRSLLPRSHPTIIPGGRFRESYYWDSYWIIKGLLASDVIITAKGLALNLLDDVLNFGFIPNGGRIYYVLESQSAAFIS